MIDMETYQAVWQVVTQGIELGAIEVEDAGLTIWNATRPDVEGETKDLLDLIKRRLPPEDLYHLNGLIGFPSVRLWMIDDNGRQDTKLASAGVVISPQWDPDVPAGVLGRFDAVADVVMEEHGITKAGETIVRLHGGLTQIVANPDSHMAELLKRHRSHVEDQVSKFRQQMSLALPTAQEGGDEHGPNPSDPD